MYRKGTFNNKNEPNSRPESSGRICKTPRLVLTKLNIPLNSVVIVKGDSVIIPSDSSENKPSEPNNITDSDDDLSNDVDFQKMVIKRFQSTKERGSNEKCETVNASKRLEQSDIDEASKQTSSSKDEPQIPKSHYSFGPKSRRKLLPHPRKIRKKIKGMSNIAEKDSSKSLLPSESDECLSGIERIVSEHCANSKSDHETDENAVLNVNDQSKESSTVSKISYVYSNKTNTKKSNSISKSGHSSNKINIDEDVAEIIAMLEDSPVEKEENEDSDVSGNKKGTNATQPDFTPSRISQRIKNKKVKFSALRLLAGGDIPSSRKKVHPNSVKKTSTPKKSVVKTKANNSTADINANNSDLSPIEREESITKAMKERIRHSENEEIEDSVDKPKVNKSVPPKQLKQYTNVKKTLASKNKSIGNSAKMPPPPEKVSVSSPPNEKETDDLGSTNSKNKINLNESRTNGNEEIEKSSLDRENHVEIKEANNKVRVELQGAPQRKIVNITISPKKSSLRHEGLQKDNLKEKKDIELGPDIIIRKIKSGKKLDIDKTVSSGKKLEIDKTVSSGKKPEVDKTVSSGKKLENDKTVSSGKKLENDKTVSSIGEKEKTVSSSENVQDTNADTTVNIVSDAFQNNLIIKNLIYPEKTTKSGIKPMKEVEVPMQIQKFILESAKNKKPNENCNDLLINPKNTFTYKAKKKSEINKKRYDTKGKQKVQLIQSSDEEYSDNNTELDHSDVQIVNSTLEDDDVTDGDGSIDRVSKRSTAKLGDAKKHSMEEAVSSNVMKVGGKKTAKVLPLRQVTKIPPKSDMIKKVSNDIQKSKNLSGFSSTDLCTVGGKRNYRNAFEKYFQCTEKIYEHNDSMDSDSSSDDEDNLFSHFIDLRRRNRSNKQVIDEHAMPEHSEEVVGQAENNEQANTLNTEDNNSIISELGEVIKGIITTDLPKWTCHAIPENSVICLLLLERETNGTYDVRKSIEINDNFNANVYVNKKLINEYCGVYDSYDAIKNLIYQVELL